MDWSGYWNRGNSQYFGIELYSQKAHYDVFIQRWNPDLDYSWYIDNSIDRNTYTPNNQLEKNARAKLDLGLSISHFLTKQFNFTGSVILNRNFNATNNLEDSRADKLRYNWIFQTGIKYSF